MLASLAGFRQLIRNINIFDTLILRQDAQRCRIGGELVIGVTKVGVLLILQL
jgi:hypothetical protein